MKYVVGGAIFDGVGAISGGGGETVLLPSYPAESQGIVLDYLLKPSFGASLHILKIEVGGDALSTDGAEPSHMPTEHGAPDYSRGYEWWMAKEAKKRNARIKLYALPWEWPAWVGAGRTTDPYRNLSKPLHYVIEWLRGARAAHGLSFDFMGIWNENECNPDYIVALRKALDGAGFNRTQIIAPDGAKVDAAKLIDTMLARADVAAAVHAVGYHYPDSDSGVPATTQAQLGLPLWASEDDSTVSPPADAPPTPRPRQQPGGACLVRTINQNWVQGNLTATIVWNLVMARYPEMRWDYTGLVEATDPFGGHYTVLPPVWAAAHTTQFTTPGWRLLRVGGGSGWLRRGGTYVGYAGPATSQSAGGDLTIVIEKMNANQSKCQRGQRPAGQIVTTEAENATFVLSGWRGASRLPENLAVWSSHFGDGEGTNELFVRMPDLPIVGGGVTLEVLPNWAYTLSTIRTATRGGLASSNDATGARGTPPPPRGQFPATYADDFDTCALSGLPRYVAPLAGAFECTAAGGGRAGRAVRQMSPAKGICDRGDVMPYVIIGDGFRTTYNVSIDVLLPPSPLAAGSGGAFVGARTKGPVGSGTGMDGVFLAINATGWHVALTVGAIGSRASVLASGFWPLSFATGTWRRLSLATRAGAATASIDGTVLAPALTIPAPHDHHTARVAGVVVSLGMGGYASFGTVGYADVQFDRLAVDSSA